MVVEGIGDHGCEYMTGGRVAVLGKVGVNFAAGMTGGLAYVYDADNNFDQKCNLGSVDLETVMPHSADEAELLQLIYEHYMAPRSRRAYDLLNNWPERRFSSLSHSAFEAGNLPVRRHFGGCSVRLPGNGRSGCRTFGDECSG